MEYLLKISAVIAIFHLSYKLFLQRDTFFESNRLFLLLGLVSSFIIPFIIIPIYIEYTPINISGFAINEVTSAETIEKPFHILDYLPIMYGLGVLFFSIRFLSQLGSLSLVIFKNKGTKKEGYTFIETSNAMSPFSFFKWIVYNPNPFSETELEQIITHEKTHANQYHSIDILLTQLSCIVLWFNPFIWFYNKDLKQNLEFIADKTTLKQNHCKKSYQYTLLKTSIPSHQMALSNNFYNSLIKKRIVMLHKSKSKKINQLKYVLVIPLLIAFLISCNSEVINNNTESKTSQINTPNAKEKSSSITIKGSPVNGLHPLIIVDGKEIPNDDLEKLNSDAIFRVDILKDENHTKKYGEKGKNGVILITTKGNEKDETNLLIGKPLDDVKVIGFGAVSDTISFNLKGISNEDGTSPLLIVDGKELKEEKIKPESVESINVLKGESAPKKYGDKAKNGVIEITTKK